MKESIGMSTILNIIIIFIVSVFAAIAGIISYNKAFKVSTRIGDAIERAEGYNDISKAEINRILGSLGYRKGTINCGSNGQTDGLYMYCVYPIAKVNDHYQYEVLTYMYFDFPIINELKVSIKTKTDFIYCFKETGC